MTKMKRYTLLSGTGTGTGRGTGIVGIGTGIRTGIGRVALNSLR
jgi:hypothetical protein